MNDLPSIELLESTHEFPCDYMFKVIGEDDHAFAGRVVAVVREETDGEHEPAMHLRRTASGRHVCVTIEPRVENARQVLALYERFFTLPGLVMLW